MVVASSPEPENDDDDSLEFLIADLFSITHSDAKEISIRFLEDMMTEPPKTKEVRISLTIPVVVPANTPLENLSLMGTLRVVNSKSAHPILSTLTTFKDVIIEEAE
jgi:hypothetical protein